MALVEGAKPRPYLEAPWAEFEIQLSPDGKLAAITSSEAGGMDIWIRDFPVPRGKWQVSTNQLSYSPRWSRDGHYVYYWRVASALADTLFRARVERTPGIMVRAPEVVLVLDIDDVGNWDLHPDGKRLIASVADERRRGDAGSPGQPAFRYLVVQNWFKELKALAGKEGGR